MDTLVAPVTDNVSTSPQSPILREIAVRAAAMGLQVQCSSDGSVLSRIAIVAEAPGSNEVAKGLPLVGGSGRFLWDLLRPLGVTRTQCYITNVVKRQLTSKTGEKEKIGSAELRMWKELLQWELGQLQNVEYVLLMGDFALNAVAMLDGITKWRGSMVPVVLQHGKTVPAFITFNAAYPMSVPKVEVTFRFDIGKFGRLLSGKFRVPKIETRYDLSISEIVQTLEQIADEKKPTAYDIESAGGETACYGFANHPTQATCINLRTLDANLFTVREERALLLRLQRTFNAPGIRWIAQKGEFDSYWTWYRDRVKLPPLWMDTLLAHHTLYPLLPHDLGYLTAQYTDHPYYKDEKDTWREGGNISQYWQYNGKDCCIELQAALQLEQELRENKLDSFFFNHVMRLQPHLVLMTVGGIKIDPIEHQRVLIAIREAVAQKEKAFIDSVRVATGDPNYQMKPLSVPDKQKLFFGVLGLVGRGSSTDAENRAKMRAHPRTSENARIMLDKYDAFAEDHKFASTYAEMSLDPDGRVRCEYRQSGTTNAPGRLSSASTMWGSGLNLQNIPQRAYAMFVADPGYMFTYFDLSQAEARIVAYEARVKRLIANFELAAGQGVDVHRANAATIFKLPYDQIPSYDRDAEDRPTKRYLGKRCVHGLNYRLQPAKLAAVCEIPIHQAVDAYNAYHAAFPEIQEWWEEIIRDARKTREIWNFMGRRLAITMKIEEDFEGTLIAFKPQSTIGDKVAGCIYLCHEDKDWPRLRNGQLAARIALNVHDSLVAIHRTNDKVAAEIRAVMKRHAEAPILVRGTPIVIPTEFKESKPYTVILDKKTNKEVARIEDGVHRWSTLQKVKVVA